MLDKLKASPYFPEIALIAALAMVIVAWKFMIEGIHGE